MSFTDSNHFSMSLSFSYWNITEGHPQKYRINIGGGPSHGYRHHHHHHHQSSH